MNEPWASGAGAAVAMPATMKGKSSHQHQQAAAARSLRARCWRPIQLNNQVWIGSEQGGQVPGPRSGAASVVVANKMFMFGGYGGSGRLDDFFEFDFDSRMWRRQVAGRWQWPLLVVVFVIIDE